MVADEDLTLGTGHMMQKTGSISQKCTSVNCIILVTNIIPTNLKKKHEQ